MLRTTQSKVAAMLTAATLLMPTAAMAYDPDLSMVAEAPVAEAKPGKAAPALAEVKVTREQAIANVAKLFPIPAELGEPNVSLSQSTAGAAWRLEWSTSPRAAVRKSMYAGVDAVTGTVLSFSRSSSESESKELTYSRGEAYKLAADWAAKLAGDRIASLRYVDDPLEYGFYGGANAFRFHWDRMEQGYPVSGDGLDITIDARTGDLTEYSQNWRSTATFTLPATLLSQEKAHEAYLSQLPLLMQYQRYQKPGVDQGEWRLVYRTKMGFWPSVNMEGKLLGYDGAVIDVADFGESKLVPAAEKAYQKPEKPLTPAEALAVAKAVAGRSDEPANVDCNESGQEKKVSSCHFNWFQESEESNINVAVNLETGLVSNYSQWNRSRDRDAKPAMTEAQARAKAVEFLRQYRPDLAGKVLLSPPAKRPFEMKEPMPNYHISFQMTHNYVPVNGQSASVEFDAITGRLQYFWGPEFQVSEKEPMPALTGLLKPEQALDAFLKAKGLELTWMGVVDPEAAKRLYLYGGPMATANQEMTLVWAPKRNMPVETIGAQNGVLYDFAGRDLIQAAMRPSDIEGHPAQREIELLWARGIFELTDGKFNPEQTVSAAELARWLVVARGLQPYVAYDYALNFSAKAATGERLANSSEAPYFGAALQAGILLPEDFSDDADPSAPVSRELYALWAVRAMGYGPIASMENRIAMPFADQSAIGAKYFNAVAVLNGLKVVKGDAATAFGPQQLVTRGDAAKILFAVASQSSGIRSYWK